MTNHKTPFNTLTLPELDGPALLKFGTTNAKLRNSKTADFSLPAGYTCPGAKECLAWFDRAERKLKDGPDAKHRCFAASMEAAFSTVQRSVDRNLALLKAAKTAEGMAELIDMSLPGRFYENIRIHADGDFFSQAYFEAWIRVAVENPNRVFYAYTKSLPLWIKLRGTMPRNFVLTASYGGKWDNLIAPNKLRSAKVVMHPDEAEFLGLEIDHDDSLARNPDAPSFALLLHGQQRAGSPAAAAKKRLVDEKIPHTYSRKK
jgi:hypothetical protein